MAALLLCLNFRCVGFRHSALNISAAQASGADIHPLDAAVHHHTDTLHIGRPGGVGLAVGMADFVTIQCALATDLTELTHDHSPPHWSQDTSKLGYCIISLEKMQGILKKVGTAGLMS